MKPKKNEKRVPRTLSEPYLLENPFKKDGITRFVTYAGFVDASVARVENYNIVLAGGKRLPKINILLAFPKIKMDDVKRGIKRRNSIAAKGWTAIAHIKDRPKVPVKTKPRDTVECVMRNGLVVTGETVMLSKYNLILRVGGSRAGVGKIVLVYRHGLHDFKVLPSEKVPAKPDDASDGAAAATDQ